MTQSKPLISCLPLAINACPNLSSIYSQSCKLTLTSCERRAHFCPFVAPSPPENTSVPADTADPLDPVAGADRPGSLAAAHKD